VTNHHNPVPDDYLGPHFQPVSPVSFHCPSKFLRKLKACYQVGDLLRNDRPIDLHPTGAKRPYKNSPREWEVWKLPTDSVVMFLGDQVFEKVTNLGPAGTHWFVVSVFLHDGKTLASHDILFERNSLYSVREMLSIVFKEIE